MRLSYIDRQTFALIRGEWGSEAGGVRDGLGEKIPPRSTPTVGRRGYKMGVHKRNQVGLLPYVHSPCKIKSVALFLISMGKGGCFDKCHAGYDNNS